MKTAGSIHVVAALRAGIDRMVCTHYDSAMATVELKTAAPETVTVDGGPAAGAPGVISAQSKEGKIEIVVGSGCYQVRAANPGRGITRRTLPLASY